MRMHRTYSGCATWRTNAYWIWYYVDRLVYFYYRHLYKKARTSFKRVTIDRMHKCQELASQVAVQAASIPRPGRDR